METNLEFLKRRQDFAGDTGIFDARTRGVTIFFLRPQRDFGKPAVSKECPARHAPIRLHLSLVSSQKMMPGGSSSGSGAVNVISALKKP